MSIPSRPFDYEVNVPILTDFCMQYYVRDGDDLCDARIFPPHVDDKIEFYILLEGDVSFMVEHSLYRLSPGDIVITKPNEMHNCILNTNSRHRHMCFWFDPSEDFLFSDFLAHNFGEDNVCSPTPEDAMRIADTCRELYAVSEQGKDKVGEFHLGMQLLYYVRRNLGSHGQAAVIPDILRRILERGITGAAVATILDPESVKKCEQAGVGNTVHLSLGGWSDPVLSGAPIEMDAYVRAITDGKYVFKGKMSHGLWGTHGKAAVIEVGGNVVFVTSLTRQPFDLEVFRSHGIAPEECKILVTKSSVHFRADYGKIAKAMYTLALPGVASPDPKSYQYKNWKGKV